MIKEAYCSFEVAKLLKENGMDKGYFTYYIQKNNTDGTCEAVTTCTHQMAMAWLREIHNIFINIDVIPYTTVTIEQRYYFYKIYRNRRLINFSPQIEDIQFYNTPEEAVEAALKYCLENLI